MALPFATTSVPASHSMSDIEAMLEGCGFKDTARVNNGGVRTIHARQGRVEFMFTIDVHNIVKAIIDHSSRSKQREIRVKSVRGNAWLEDLREQAERVGWRLMFAHVKALCDSIKLGVISPAQAFAGHLVTGRTSDGAPTLLADAIVLLESNPDFRPAGLLAGLLPYKEVQP